MKLLTRNTSYFFFFSTIAFILAGIALYLTIHSIVYRQIDNSLLVEKTIIQDQLEETDSIPDFTASFGHLIEVKLLYSPVKFLQVIKDTNIYDVKSASFIQFRHLKFRSNTPRNTGYVINIYQGLDENQELMDSIGLGMFLLFLTLLLVSILVNYLISKKIWRPFYNVVNEASNFDVLSDYRFQLPYTNIEEFKKLNKVFEQMTKKMRSDYLNLKEYNENSSHEILTPLAVIRSKLDILIQSKSLDREDILLIQSINEAVTRIFKLNQGLLLISKIENLQFPEIKTISLKKLIESSMENYEEILRIKNIKVETEFSDPGLVAVNETLAEILVSNLLGNAVRYNLDNGFIICRLNNMSLTVTNSGMPLKGDPERLFKRFQRGTDHPQSIGLGLAIVKKISDHYKMQINYSCTGTVHELTLNYNSISCS